MGWYAVRRVLSGMPVLVAVSIVVFLLSTMAPGDPVEQLIGAEDNRLYASREATYTQKMTEYRRAASRLHMDLPPFYLSVIPATCSPEVLEIPHKGERRAARAWCARGVEATNVLDYRGAMLRTLGDLERDEKMDPGIRGRMTSNLEFLLRTADPERSEALVRDLLAQTESASDWSPGTHEIASLFDTMRARQGKGLGAILPRVVWHGSSNRYHHWLTDLLKGDPGISLIDGRPVGRKIREALAWTLRINVVTIMLAFLISVPLGLSAARRKGSRFDRWTSRTLFIFFAIPSFWLATLFVVFLTTPEYGQWLDLFPGSGTGRLQTANSGLERLWITSKHLFLPVISLLLGSLAYLTRQMRQSVVREEGKDYVRMSRAKGLSETLVFRRHILRNALFPMITIFGAAIPASISGSVVIEVIFSIPGMGRLLYTSIQSQDWGVTMAIVLLAATLTVIGFALSDILYRWADPRLRIKAATF